MDNHQPETSGLQRDEVCPTHGAYVSTNFYRDKWSSCGACAKALSEQQEADAREAERRVRQKIRTIRSGLRGRFLDATFATYTAGTPNQAAVLAACRSYAEDFGDGTSGLWLLGKPGTGKTHLGSAIVNFVIATHDAQAMIFSGREIIRLLRSTWGDKAQPMIGAVETASGGYVEIRYPETEAGMIDMLGEVPLLVIDEIGVSFGSDAETVQLFDVIDRRYSLRLPTVILSNLTAPELKGVLGDRAYDRLREGARLLNCKWPSARGASDTDRA